MNLISVSCPYEIIVYSVLNSTRLECTQSADNNLFHSYGPLGEIILSNIQPSYSVLSLASIRVL